MGENCSLRPPQSPWDTLIHHEGWRAEHTVTAASDCHDRWRRHKMATARTATVTAHQTAPIRSAAAIALCTESPGPLHASTKSPFMSQYASSFRALSLNLVVLPYPHVHLGVAPGGAALPPGALLPPLPGEGLPAPAGWGGVIVETLALHPLTVRFAHRAPPGRGSNATEPSPPAGERVGDGSCAGGEGRLVFDFRQAVPRSEASAPHPPAPSPLLGATGSYIHLGAVPGEQLCRRVQGHLRHANRGRRLSHPRRDEL